MKIPTIQGIIDRRILINFTVAPELAAKVIPLPFRPKVYKGKAIVGICLIRLRQIRPKGFPALFGISSENGAHRIAVEWDEHGVIKEGVYIPRRDTSLKLNALVGGRIFPGRHHLAQFNVQEANGCYHVDFKSDDGTLISIDASETATYNSSSVFETLDEVSSFFEKGSVGYSPNGKKFDGMKLNAYQWKVSPLEVSHVSSSFFEDESIFPKGSVQFDNALLMTGIGHDWQSVEDKHGL